MKVHLGKELWWSELQIAALVWWGIREGVLDGREELKRIGTYTAVLKVAYHLLNADVLQVTAAYQESMGYPEVLR